VDLESCDKQKKKKKKKKRPYHLGFLKGLANGGPPKVVLTGPRHGKRVVFEKKYLVLLER